MIERKFGVEIEIVSNIPVYSLRRAVEKCHEPLKQDGGFYYHSDRNTTQWDVKTDASVRCGCYGSGRELVTPVLSGERGLVRLVAVVSMINKHARRIRDKSKRLVDESSGLHVHVDVQDLDYPQVGRLCWLYFRYQEVLFKLCAPHRETNHYCGKMKPEVSLVDLEDSTTVDALKKLYLEPSGSRWRYNEGDPFSTRKCSLNLTTFTTRGDVEFRLKESTLDIWEIEAWTYLLVSLVERAKTGLRIRDIANKPTLETLFDLVGWSKDPSFKIRGYMEILRRINRGVSVPHGDRVSTAAVQAR